VTQRDTFYVETSEPESRKAPIVEAGALGWMRENLFSTWWNTLLTVVSITVIVFALVGFFNWTVQQANWAVITNNLHLFAIGTYPQAEAWRPVVATLALMFLLGLTWRLWGRAARLVGVLTVLGVVLLYGLPLVAASQPYPNTYTLIGGPTTDSIQGLAYLAEEGEQITFRLDPVLDFGAPIPDGFTDRTSLTIAGLARQEAQAQQRAVDAAVADGQPLPADIPPGAFVSFDEEIDDFVVQPPDVTATVTIFQAVYETTTGGDGQTTLTQTDVVELESFSAGPGAEPATLDFTFPEAGWTIILPEREGEIGGFWLETEAFQPLSASSIVAEARQAEFGPPPDLEGRHVQVLTTAYIPFRGVSTLQDFIKLHVGPLAAGLANLTLALAIAMAAGYGLGALMSRNGPVNDGDPATTHPNADQPVESPARRIAMILWALSPVFIFALLLGFTGPDGPVPVVEMERWGGLLLTMALSVVGIVAAFPIGVLLALGRRSTLPVVRIFCVISIEFVRGVPLVTILFAASLLVPLADPSLSSVDNVVRAMIGMTFFSGAYLAEIVRGGLQAVPHGQTEAAKAVGMSGWQITLFIVLPQALRAVIPAIMGQFVSLFKDTTLVLIIGLLDLLGISRSVINQAEYIGLQRETLVFISVIYFVLSYLMSWTSRRVEQTGSGAFRRA